MQWDDFTGLEETADGSEPEVICPEGEHVGTIDGVLLRTKDFARHATKNPEGKVLTVIIDVKPGIKKVWDDIPCDRLSVVQALCASAGVHPPSRGEWDEKQLKGKAVRFESVIVLGKAGGEFVRVAKYLKGVDPLPKAVSARTPAKRTATQKADAAATAGTGDDIPF